LQTLTLKKSNTLVGFNIVVSVEWTPTPATERAAAGFQSASDYLYDASMTNAVRAVTIYD